MSYNIPIYTLVNRLVRKESERSGEERRLGADCVGGKWH